MNPRLEHEGDFRPRPPALSRWLVAHLCPPEDRAFVVSDLAEEFESRAAAEGRRRARWWYRAQVMRSVLPCVARRISEAAERWGSVAPSLHGLGADVRYAVRRLTASPVQVVVTVLSLGIGIGLTTSVFAIANAFLLQSPGGLTDTDGLVALYTSDEKGSTYDANSYPDLEDIAREADIFRGVTAIRPGIVRWTEGESFRRIIVEIVDGNYFDILGIKPALGRTFAPEETILGSAEPLTVISYELWKTHFGGNPSVLGRTLRLDGRDFTVIGVAPEGLLGRLFRLKVEAWVPLGLPGGIYHATPRELTNRDAREYIAYARLQPGVWVEQARARMKVLATRFHEQYGTTWTDDHGAVRTLSVLTEEESRVRPDMRAALAGAAAFFLAGAASILLIACINVAGLFLARAHKRRREVAVRLSLGAGRRRVVRLLLVEALLLALLGGALGIGVASLSARFLGAIPFPLDIPLAFVVDIDTRVLLFALATALGTCLAFGLVPAVRASRTDLVAILKGDVAGRLRRRITARGALVTLQIAGSLVFLVATGLCLRSFRAIATTDPGLHGDGIALASWRDGVSADDASVAQRKVLDLAERLQASPDIDQVSVAAVAELSLWADYATARVRVEGFQAPSGEDPVLRFNSVTPGYFEMLGMRLLRGRSLTHTDVAGALPVALVNETFVRTYWPGESALGRRFTVLGTRSFGTPTASPEATYEVVGVLNDVRANPGEDRRPYFWTSFLQDPARTVIFHVRGHRDAASAVPELRRIVQGDPADVPLVSAQTYADLITFNTMGQRLALKAFTWSGAFALLLAVIGIYGMISFAVGQRAREMAIRQAVGAGRGTVIRSILLDGLRLTGIGAAIGLAIVVPAASLARSALFGVSPVDPAALLGSVAILAVAALAATAPPARRAAHADPMRFLRDE